MHVFSDKFGEIDKIQFVSIDHAFQGAEARAITWKRQIFLLDQKSGKSWSFNAKGEKVELKSRG